MNALWNPPETLPASRRVVLVFNFPVAQADGGSFVPVAHVGSFSPSRGYSFSGPQAKQVYEYRNFKLLGWAEVPA